jgi:L-2-hydroxyglutarate oxidase LhgO
MVNKVEVLIVGGGIVGLATALRIMQARPLTRLTLIEKS